MILFHSGEMLNIEKRTHERLAHYYSSTTYHFDLLIGFYITQIWLQRAISFSFQLSAIIVTIFLATISSIRFYGEIKSLRLKPKGFMYDSYSDLLKSNYSEAAVLSILLGVISYFIIPYLLITKGPILKFTAFIFFITSILQSFRYICETLKPTIEPKHSHPAHFLLTYCKN